MWFSPFHFTVVQYTGRGFIINFVNCWNFCIINTFFCIPSSVDCCTFHFQLEELFRSLTLKWKAKWRHIPWWKMSPSGNGLMSTPLLLSQKLLFITGLWKVMQLINQSVNQEVYVSVCLSVCLSVSQSVIKWIHEGLKQSTCT